MEIRTEDSINDMIGRLDSHGKIVDEWNLEVFQLL